MFWFIFICLFFPKLKGLGNRNDKFVLGIVTKSFLACMSWTKVLVTDTQVQEEEIRKRKQREWF